MAFNLNFTLKDVRELMVFSIKGGVCIVALDLNNYKKEKKKHALYAGKMN